MAALNYKHLRYFRAVAHAGTLTRAAAQLNLSASALSVQLQALEDQLGHALFDRVGKRLELTETGRIALDYADTVFQAGDELLAALKGQAGTQRPVLRVGAITTLSRNFQLQFLRPLVGRTDIELVVRSGTLRELLMQLEAHELDVVLANAAARRDARVPFRSVRLDRQPVSLVARPRRGHRRFRFPEDLATTPVLLPSLDSEVRQGFDRLLETAGIRPQVLAEVDDMAMLRLLARESDGVALVPRIVVRDELASRALVERCRVDALSEDFYAIVANRRFPNPLLAGLLAERPPVRR